MKTHRFRSLRRFRSVGVPLLFLSAGLAPGLRAAEVSFQSAVPSAGDGVENLGFSTDDASNTQHAYVASDSLGNHPQGLQVGQSFTTGSNAGGYLLNSISVRQVSWTSDWDYRGGAVSLRVFDSSGGFSPSVELISQSAPVGGAAGGLVSGGMPSPPQWLTFSLTEPLPLAARTLHAFVLGSDGTDANDGFFMTLDGTAADSYSGGSSISVDGSSNLWSGEGGSDRAFVANMTAVSGGSQPPSSNVSVVVDPAGTLAGFTALGEWESAGDFEGWSTSQASATVSGGLLQGTASGNEATLLLEGIAGGPDLDLGWNDFIEMRIQVPAGYGGDVRIFYGTSYTPGFSAERSFIIHSSLIPDDGQFHTYRIDVGLVPLWRSTLSDLRIAPVSGEGTSGMNFAIDHVRVGDQPNAPVYQTITFATAPAAGASTPGDASLGAGQTVKSMESKRFRFLWNDAVEAEPSWTPDMAHGTLRNLEETWQVYTRKLGYQEPCFSDADKTGSGGSVRGKINVTSWYFGYWATVRDGGANGGRAVFNATPDGLRVDPPTWVIPHELMHDYQFYNTDDDMPGYWYEGHANYARERWLAHYQDLYPGSSSISPDAIRSAHQIFGDGRYQYNAWLPMLYLDSNPDGLPDLGEGTVAEIWQANPSQTSHPFMTLDSIASTTGRKDVFGYYARRGATLSYPVQPNIASAISWDVQVPRYQITDLVRRSDDPSWWRVPFEMAPQQAAYTIHELAVPNPGTAGRVVTVDFHGLPNTARGADWRVAFVVVADDGSERYSGLWNDGGQSVTLAANENTLYLSVAATPDEFIFIDWDESKYPYRSHPGKERFPYEVRVTGATPKARDNGGTSGLVQHANGGGWKSPGASVAATAYVGPNARVLGNAVVAGNARVEDFAVVQDSAQLLDEAVVSGHAWIMNNAVVSDYAKVRDWAAVRESAVLSGEARALEHADVKGGSQVTDTAVVKGTAVDLGGTLSGNAIIDGNYWAGRDLDSGFVTGHQPFLGVPDEWITPLPDGLYAAYEFSSSHESRIIDRYGVTDGLMVGSPVWVESDGDFRGVLSFNGVEQHVNLDRSVADMRQFTFSAWVKPAGGASNQAVLWLGASPTQRLSFTPDDGSGQAQFSIVDGGAAQALAAPALATGQWTHVAVTLSGSLGVLYLDGQPVDAAPINIRADRMLAPNTADGLQHNYLARAEGSEMASFAGALDDVHFYSSVLTPARVAEIASPPPSIIGSAGSFGGLGNTREKAFDGDLGTYYDAANGSGDWVGFDLGVARRITEVRYCPRDNWASRMKGGRFEASDTPDFSSGVVTLYTIPSGIFSASPAEGVMTSRDVGDTGGYRYVRYRGPDNAYCNVAEIEFITASATSDAPGTPTDLSATPGEDQVALSWTIAGGEAGYKVKRSTTDGGPYTTIASPPQPEFTDTTVVGGTTYHYVVSAVNDGGESADSGQVSATPIPAPVVEKLTGTVIGTPGSYGNSGNTIAKVFDGDLGTFYDAIEPSGSWAGLDLGGPMRITSVRFAPRPGWAGRMVGGEFQGSNSPTFASGVVTLHTVGSAPPEGGLTEQAVSESATFRYVRYIGSSGAYCNVAEIEFYTTIQTLTPAESWRFAHFGTTENSGQAADDFDVEKDGIPNILERAFGGDPLVSDPAILPRIDPAMPMLSILYRVNLDATDLAIEVQENADLQGAWASATGSEGIVETIGNIRTIRFTRPVAGEIALFLRLSVSAP